MTQLVLSKIRYQNSPHQHLTVGMDSTGLSYAGELTYMLSEVNKRKILARQKRGIIKHFVIFAHGLE